MSWLSIRRGQAPLLLSVPHAGTEIPAELEARLVSPWLARKDADWWVDKLYGFAADLDATILAASVSRTVIDVNRDPSGRSLYPGQATTGLCPTTTFDGERLYEGDEPDAAEIETRRGLYFDPYHALLAAEIARLRAAHSAIVVYDAHSIRSRVPRLFDDLLPHFNIGTNLGRSCAARLTAGVARACAEDPYTLVVDGRFQGGYITRRYGDPAGGVHAIQMELACRTYLREPAAALNAENWPAPFNEEDAAEARRVLRRALSACLDFAAAEGKRP